MSVGGGAVFFDRFFFAAVLAHSVLLRPVLGFVPFCFLEEVVVGAEAGSGEHGCSSSTNIGSPSSSNKFAVSISQAGYFLVGLTLRAKLATVKRSTFSGVLRRH